MSYKRDTFRGKEFVDGDGYTFREHRDKRYVPGTYDQHGRKKRLDKKFFGDTSGTKVKTLRKIDESGHITYVETANTGVKGVDYVKSGWPFETRHRKVIKNLDIERSFQEEGD